ncbi:serine/threonine-protein kinase [Polyangium sp. y55x31]|uniref:serine/threonine-protein kinase n=1 Tax=Polyangium sp. y55x31 TaxID=3042688 RepID=UPI0024826762|nr:serine/threonine-protein kinase [Polyangium sp. y55x31]MDI1482671.1 serine/threonine-protein kinase [Polyangium sp. y55x31]
MENEAVRSPVAAGEILAGKYRVERLLGMGGMGVVVAATHLELRDERAIKLVRSELTHPQIIERFFREARLVVKLRSEHVAQVYDIGRLPSGAPFMVMELLQGDDLSALLKKRGTLPVHEAVLYVMQACDALAEAHGRGIVHRDLKPANLFLTHREDGSPCIKVLDFGVSKYVPEDGESEMTSNGDIMGSPLYMAPEQMRAAREVDARADIWALGAILYKLLTGRAPFQRATTPEICMAVLGSEMAPLPSSIHAGIPSGLEAVIMRCLCKDVDSRFPRAVDLKAALSPYSERREGWAEDERASLSDDPRSSSRVSNSSRPIPKNIDAILLGCIGKDSGRRAARAKGRRTKSDPFLKRAEAVEPKAPAAAPAEPPCEMPRDPELSCMGGGTVPMGSTDLRRAREMGFGGPPQALQPTTPALEPDTKRTPALLDPEGTIDEATALAPPRLPSFPAPPPPSVRTSLPTFPVPSPSEPIGNSMAPWDYAPAPPPAPRRAKSVAFLASATTAVFIIVALVMAFTTGGENNVAEGAMRSPDTRPAAGGMPTPAEVAIEPEPEAEAEAAAPATSASAAAEALVVP